MGAQTLRSPPGVKQISGDLRDPPRSPGLGLHNAPYIPHVHGAMLPCLPLLSTDPSAPGTRHR